MIYIICKYSEIKNFYILHQGCHWNLIIFTLPYILKNCCLKYCFKLTWWILTLDFTFTLPDYQYLWDVVRLLPLDRENFTLYLSLANKINWIKVFINNIVNNRKHYLIETYSSTTKVAEQLSNGIQVPLLTFINLYLPLFTCISHSVDWIARFHPELKLSWKVGWTAEQWLSVTFSYLFSHISVDWIAQLHRVVSPTV